MSSFKESLGEDIVRFGDSPTANLSDKLVAPAAGAGGDDDDDDDGNGPSADKTESELALEELNWIYTPPPNTSKGTWEFYDEQPNGGAKKLFAKFTSDFCSGNLAGVTRVAPTKFELHIANDNMGADWATNNKMWFYFSVTGVPQGTTLSFTMVQVPFTKTYHYSFSPVVSVDPLRPTFQRMSTSVSWTPAPLPAGVAEKQAKKKAALAAAVSSAAAAADAGNDASSTAPPTPTSTTGPPSTPGKQADPQYCNLHFDYCFDATPRFVAVSTNPAAAAAAAAVASGEKQLTYNFAFGHPYSYEKMQRHLASWYTHFGPEAHILLPAKAAAEQATAASPQQPPPTLATSSAVNYVATSAANLALINNPGRFHPVMYRELLTRSLDGNRVDLITITARTHDPSSYSSSSFSPSRAKQRATSHPLKKEARFGPDGCLPLETAAPPSKSKKDDAATAPTVAGAEADLDPEEPARAPAAAGGERAPPVFPNRKYVLLTARVHPGEVPASHVMHGFVEFLLNTEDPRAAALRENFVFVIIPIVNPDGVVRGYTRADSCGVNLNRVYKNPSRKKHPTVWAIRELMMHLAGTGGPAAAASTATANKLALYVDMHAHANKRGAFFYANAMPAAKQVENLLFTKLVALNTPYFSFTDCNFTNSNMYSLGKTGVCRDGSGRVSAFLTTCTVHSYTLECNSVVGPATNAVAALPQRGEEEKPVVQNCPRYTPQIFHEIGRGVLQALLDYHGVNPLSRVSNGASEPFRNVQAVRTFIGAALYNDASEQIRKRKNEFVVSGPTEPGIDVDADGPVTTVHGPRMPLPPTTTTCNLASLQPYMQQATMLGLMQYVRGMVNGFMSSSSASASIGQAAGGAGGSGPLRQLSFQNRATAAASRRRNSSTASAASTSSSPSSASAAKPRVPSVAASGASSLRRKPASSSAAQVRAAVQGKKL